MSKKTLILVIAAAAAGLLITLAVLALAASMFLTTFERRPVQADGGLQLVMGTFARVVVVAEDSQTAQKAIRAALEEIRKVDDAMSDYKDDSELSAVNRDAFDRPVAVSPQTFHVLRKALEFNEISDGAFDVTIGPLVDLWRAAAEADSPPAEADIAAAREKVGSEKLILDPNNMTVRFAVRGMRLDLGAIAKGYAIDRAVDALIRNRATGAMVDVGGDIRCFGTPANRNTQWRIGLQDPNDTAGLMGTGKPLLVLKLRNVAVATSGDYRRFALIDGKKHSHIITPRTGRSSDELTSVTVIARDAITADALATAVSVLGPEKGLALIESVPDAEAILISPPPQHQMTKTSGADRYID